MIRKFQISDMEEVMRIWFLGNKDAHSFIPEGYWYSHFNEVREGLLQADVFVYDVNGKIQGFIGMVNEYIAGIFVDGTCRSSGVGKQLLSYVKRKNDRLLLGVYQKNTRAIAFYQKEGFLILSDAVDEVTGEQEYTMFWKRI